MSFLTSFTLYQKHMLDSPLGLRP